MRGQSRSYIISRIIHFFNHDWITTGRKPNGLCGAAIFIAARINGIQKELKEIAQVVHVCEQTLRKRINEFCATSVSDFNIEKFKEIDSLQLTTEGENPPSFKVATELQLEDIKLLRRKRKAEKQEEIKEEVECDDDELSDLNEDEEQEYLLTKDERKLKKMLWEIVNRDWIIENGHKLKKKKNVESKRKYKKAIKIEAENVVEAITKSEKLSKTINTSKLPKLFNN